MRQNYKPLRKEFEKKKIHSVNQISLCPRCHTMTKTIMKHNNLICGKCEGLKE